ncbi:MAG TPA: hypothetical protein VFN74_12840, partial [Chloroflexota bacterium]|nr:hypothetical protein [Chloroflexota bacterium]
YRVASILGVREVLCPFAAGVGSTIGFLAAPLAFDYVRSHYGVLGRLDWGAVAALYREMEEVGRTVLGSAGVPEERVTVTRTADMRLYGQAHQIAVPIPTGPLDKSSEAEVRAAFEAAYGALYGRTTPGVEVEAISWRVTVSGPRPTLSLRHRIRPEPFDGLRRSLVEGPAGATPLAGENSSSARTDHTHPAQKGEREVYFPETGFIPTPVYDRYALAPDTRLDGPAVIEERESTAVVGPGASVHVDEWSNLVIGMSDGGSGA